MFLAGLSLTLFSAFRGAFSIPTGTSPGHVAAAWYAYWHTAGLPLSSVDWSNYNTLIYSFAVTTSSAGELSLDGASPWFLDSFVQEAHDHDVEAHVAIGGWGGGIWFSSNVATAENRTTFVQTVVDFVEEYDLDGINFDWEYPNHQGIGCNVVSPDDSENFFLFLQELRGKVGDTLTISAATSVTPFIDASGNPSTDVSAFSKVLDYITVMNYDLWGPWSSSVGPNAPLNDACAPVGYQEGSAMSAVKAWTAAGMPANQIVLGVASYGHSFSVSPSNAFVGGSEALASYPQFDASNQPNGDAWDDTGSVDACGVWHGPGGTFRFWGLVDGGFLGPDGNPAPGIYYRYDECSQTPYVYNKTTEVMVSFDNVQSFAAKGNYIKQAGLRGFAMWEAAGDYENMLLDSITTAAGF